MPSIQLSAKIASSRLGNPRYSEIPDEDVDIEDAERTIQTREKKGFKDFALIGGAFIAFLVFLTLTGYYSVTVFMPPINVYQTSHKWPEDRVSPMSASTMFQRGFNVGMVSFGNTRCSNVMKFIDAGTGYVCKPPNPEESASVVVDRQQTHQVSNRIKAMQIHKYTE